MLTEPLSGCVKLGNLLKLNKLQFFVSEMWTAALTAKSFYKNLMMNCMFKYLKCTVVAW